MALVTPTLLWGIPLLYVIISSIYNLYFHPLARFPGPKTWQCSYLFRCRAGIMGTLNFSLQQLHKTYGPVVRYSPNELSFISPAAWRDIYGHQANPPNKEPNFYGMIQSSRDGSSSIWTADKHNHPRLRKGLSHAFSERSLRDQEVYIKKYVNLLIQRLGELADTTDAPTNMVEWYNFTTFDITGDLVTGLSFDCLRNGRYHEWVEGFWKTTKFGGIVYAITASMGLTFLKVIRLFFPRHMKEARQRNLRLVGESTEKRLAQGIVKEKPDMISYLLEQERMADGALLSAGEVEANVGFLLIAGTETTATALSAVTYHLLKSPNALRRIVEEVRGAFKYEDDISFNSSVELPYLQACLNEILRLCPPIPAIPPRRTLRDTVTMIDGHAVPGNVTVGVPIFVASNSPENFHRPDEFLPERWLLSKEAREASPFRHDQHAATQPFSTGPRNCIGKALAYKEMRIILARVLWNFDLELAPESDGWEKQKIYISWNQGPLMVRLRRR